MPGLCLRVRPIQRASQGDKRAVSSIDLVLRVAMFLSRSETEGDVPQCEANAHGLLSPGTISLSLACPSRRDDENRVVVEMEMEMEMGCVGIPSQNVLLPRWLLPGARVFLVRPGSIGSNDRIHFTIPFPPLHAHCLALRAMHPWTASHRIASRYIAFSR